MKTLQLKEKMTIKEIRSQLDILTVLDSYGIRPNSNNMVVCPFHSDKKPSMKVYTQTNTVYCFAGSCSVNNVDAIDFIMLMDKRDKHQAILKAKRMLGYSSSITKPTVTMSEAVNNAAMSNAATDFKAYEKSLKRHEAAKAYCTSRCLDRQLLELGYKSRKSLDKWGRGCLIFPLKNQTGEIVSLYGRSIINDGHYYQSGRQGLYPNYPDRATKRLILTECIIDAASLLQQKAITDDHSVLAMYGTNGLTEEHIAAIKNLPHLEEITFFLDGDEAGRKAVQAYTLQLSEILPKVRLMNITALDDEDINSILQAHAPNILADMVANRKSLKGVTTPSNTVTDAPKGLPPTD